MSIDIFCTMSKRQELARIQHRLQNVNIPVLEFLCSFQSSFRKYEESRKEAQTEVNTKIESLKTEIASVDEKIATVSEEIAAKKKERESKCEASKQKLASLQKEVETLRKAQQQADEASRTAITQFQAPAMATPGLASQPLDSQQLLASVAQLLSGRFGPVQGRAVDVTPEDKRHRHRGRYVPQFSSVDEDEYDEGESLGSYDTEETPPPKPTRAVTKRANPRKAPRKLNRPAPARRTATPLPAQFMPGIFDNYRYR
ncbi:chaperone ClpB [Carpediemonas membranifera]|uniref:Chaperone ClpB n=1 Tax=Carpediemonas membranifera TaxID=201153 RepID=A0A8J6BZW4_9EUKA|nr:chaperone ClpB [Carpediemonas membranifera]|eukprot:KAG9395946.1 chaperone ClpB [Carpediemonas membranifera]